jgi:ferredoxin
LPDALEFPGVAGRRVTPGFEVLWHDRRLVPFVKFLPGGAEVACAEGESLFEVGRRAGVSIDTACVGKGTCGLCRVKVVAGEPHLSRYTPAEKKHLGNVYFITKMRLSCQSFVSGDVTVEVKTLPPK